MTETVQIEETGDESRSRRSLTVPLALLAIFLILGIVLSLQLGVVWPLVNFGYIGMSLGGGMTLYVVLPKKKKPTGRKIAQLMVGVYMLGFMGVLMLNNVQIEGLFFNILLGAFGAAMMHYLIAKIVGPLIFGRLWCGWACWTAMVLDFLPFSKSPGRVAGRLGHLRYVHFILSFGFVFALVQIFGPAIGEDGSIMALFWVMVGNVLYYTVAIGMAYKYKDNRAFCKYLCPLTTLLKVGSRFSVAKIGGDADACVECGACSRACPMDIDIPKYIKSGQRVLSSECIFCQTCVNSCPHNVLSITAGADVGRTEHIRVRE